MGELDEAARLYESALLLQQGLGDGRNALVTTINLAILHLRYGENQVADVFLDQASILARDLGDQERLGQIEQLQTLSA